MLFIELLNTIFATLAGFSRAHVKAGKPLVNHIPN